MSFCVLLLGGVAAVLVGRRGYDWSRAAADPSKPANVLLISLDTTRKDHLSCYGYHRETTPEIDALAAKGLLFTRCVAMSNWTLPTHASMLTGLYPDSHGAHWTTADKPHVNPKSPTGVVSSSCETLAEVLAGSGYRTGAVVANPWYLQKVYQFDQGFEHYDDRGGEPPAPYRQATEIADEALAWLEQDDPRPFFLFLNFVDPHAPYNPPPPYNAKFRESKSGQVTRSWGMQFWFSVHERVLTQQLELSPAIQELFHSRYDAEIAYMDAEIGRIVAWLRDRRQFERTLVVVTGDHGEAFGEHFAMGHGLTLYEPEVAVPMIVKLPFQSRRQQLDYGVQHVDIMPTVLEVLDIPIPNQVQGVSMLVPNARDLFAGAYVHHENARRWKRFDRSQWAVYRGRLKYLEYSDGEGELFDLDEDPGELKNLAEVREEDLQTLRAALAEWREQTKPLPTGEPTSVDLDAEHLKRLRDLGYAQ